MKINYACERAVLSFVPSGLTLDMFGRGSREHDGWD